MNIRTMIGKFFRRNPSAQTAIIPEEQEDVFLRLKARSTLLLERLTKKGFKTNLIRSQVVFPLQSFEAGLDQILTIIKIYESRSKCPMEAVLQNPMRIALDRLLISSKGEYLQREKSLAGIANLLVLWTDLSTNPKTLDEEYVQRNRRLTVELAQGYLDFVDSLLSLK